MKKLFLFAWVFSPVILLAQETVKKKSSSNGNEEVYYVLKSDKKIKHGIYQKFGFSNNLQVEGFYKNGLKDSIWTEYWTPSIVKSKGVYADDKRTGVWEFYSRQGMLEQKYDYTKRELVYDQSIEKSKDKKYKLIKGTDTTETVLDRPPVYIGGKTREQNDFMKGFAFPLEAIKNGVGSGLMIVGFTVSKDGKASNFKIVQGLGFGYDEEALKRAKQISDNWLPAIYKGEAVDVENTVSITIKVFGAN